MSETVREWVRRENAGMAELGETFDEGEGDTSYTLRDGRANLVLDAPIVRCGDRSVVLAVDREELEALLSDLMRHGFKCGKGTATPGNHITATLDAILAKLDFREVERIIPIKHGKKMWEAGPLPGGYCEVAVLKPSAQTGEEDKE